MSWTSGGARDAENRKNFPSPKGSMPESTKGLNISRLSLRHDALGLFGRRFECAFPDRHGHRPQNYHVHPNIQIGSPQISHTQHNCCQARREVRSWERQNVKLSAIFHNTWRILPPTASIGHLAYVCHNYPTPATASSHSPKSRRKKMYLKPKLCILPLPAYISHSWLTSITTSQISAADVGSFSFLQLTYYRILLSWDERSKQCVCSVLNLTALPWFS